MNNLKTLSFIIATATLLGIGCLEEEPGPERRSFTQRFEISECGGFAQEPVAPAYCDVELLEWQHDADGTLQMTDRRVELNCCGDHRMGMALVDGVYVITQDTASGGPGPCDCNCVFDLALTVEEIPAGELPIRMERQLGEAGDEPLVVFEGTLDLRAGSGAVVVNDEPMGLPCEETEELSASAQISDCGGFHEEPETDSDGDEGYCDAELLDWVYDADAATLEIVDSRVLLNCCGDHSMDIVLEGGVYVVTERDDPGAGGGRCDCECVYDFALTAEGIAAGSIQLRLMREVTDSGAGAQEVWAGTLSLSDGAGSEVVSTEAVGIWCSES